ncbi:zinc finger protein 91 isoform X3 [Folsomia candida]|nr:zinc finger protein 91 isoform X3 [Folsomia candida]
MEYWQTTKKKAAKKFNDEGEEVEEEAMDEDVGDGNNDGLEEKGDEEDNDDDEEASAPVVSKPGRRQGPGRRVKGRFRAKLGYSTGRRRKGKIHCHQCDQDIPASNISRHMKTCHNPSHQFPCRFCTCRFVVAYGRMVHEVKNHPANVAAHGPSQVKTAMKLKKKLIRRPAAPAPPTPTKVKTEPNSARFIDAKQLVPIMTKEQKAACDSHIKKLGKGVNDSKARFQCTICKKTFLGSRNASDHLNSHYGLKPFKCPLCDYYFSFRSNVVRHIKTCHTENSNFVCPYGCGCSMQSETSLKVHVNLICTLRHQHQNKKVGSQSPDKSRTATPNARPLPLPGLRAKPHTQLQQRTQPQQVPEMGAAEPSRAGTRVLKERYLHLEVSPGIYRCEQCNKTITGSGNFRDHLNIHANIRPHKCPLCYMCFTFKSNIKRHLASAHVPNGRFVCPMKCGCSMDNQHALQSHLNKCKTEVDKHRRNQQQATSPVKIKQEVESNTLNRPSRAYPPPPPLQKILPRPPPLTPAPKFTPSQKYMQEDNNDMDEDDNNEDDDGNNNDDDSQGGKYQCNVCGKSVSCKRNLSNHMLIHLNIKPWKCLICNLHFRTMDTLKKHKSKSHGINSHYKCPQCPCKFSQSQGLAMHTNIHHKSKAIKTEPSQSNRSPVKYNQAVPRVHVQAQRQNDGEEIITPQVNLAKARTMDGNWKCHVCGKLLKKPLHLQNHMRIHSGEKPYQCQLCGHRFRLASTLYDHKKSSHRGGSYKCNLCNCAFETNLGLSRHKGIFHNTQAHDYLQRKIRFIRDKAFQTRRPIATNPPAQSNQYSVEAPILKKRLSAQQQQIRPQSATLKMQKPPQMQFSNKPSTSSMLQCGHCGLGLPSIFSLSEHQKVHRTQKPILAPTPPPTSNGDERSTQNLSPTAAASNNYRSCPICQQAIHGRTHYHKHMSGCHSGGSFRCDFCPCSFDSQGNLSRHHTLMHPNIRHSSNTGSGGRGGAITDIASSSSSMSPPIIEAEVVYDEPYDDDTMNEEYQDQEQEQEQEQQWDWRQVEASYSANNTAANDDDSIPFDVTPTGKCYTCPDCGKTFDRLNRYKLHVTVHSNVKPFKCPHCVQSFRLPGILATHVKKSHGSGQFRCVQCPARFTSTKGLSVHEFVYHKGGRLERAVGREQVAKPIPVAKAVPASVPKVTSVYSASTSRMVAPVIKKPPTLMMANPRPVKLKCHICYQIFFGTNGLKEHMKEHSNQPSTSNHGGMPKLQRMLQNPGSVYPQPNYQQRAKTEQLNRGYGGYPTDPVLIAPTSSTSTIRVMYEEEEDQAPFEIVGYDNGYDNGSAEMECDDETEYQYADQQETQEEEAQEDNYDYINADDHLEIVHEDTHFDYGNSNEDDYGVDLEEVEEEDNSQGEGQYWMYDNQSNDDTTGDFQPIFCKSCEQTFVTRDSFAFHVENNPISGSHRCSYCCSSGLSVESLPSHIDAMHPMDEIEFIESQVYGE